MPGTITYNPPPLSPARAQPLTGVFRFDPNASAASQFTALPNVRWLEIDNAEGSRPSRALFRYVFSEDASVDPAWPSRVEQVLPLDSATAPSATARYVVKQDDRLVVALLRADGTTQFLFDGFAQMPEANLSAETETVTFQALGAAIRLSDVPIEGATYRDCTQPLTPSANVATDHSLRFNPDGIGNATGPDNSTDQKFSNANTFDPTPPTCPNFIDPYVSFDPLTYFQLPRRAWTLGMAVRHLLAQYNLNETYVRNPDFGEIDNLLTAQEPTNGSYYDPNDPSTYTSVGILVEDIDVTGQTLLQAIERILQPNGFTFSLDLSTSDAGLPITSLRIYKQMADSTTRLKSLQLQAVGSQLDPGQTNVGQMRLSRDGSSVVNQPVGWPRLTQFEVGIVLAPGFTIAASDSNVTNLDLWKTSNNASTFDPDKYRLFVADEAGEGHWSFSASSWQEGVPCDLSQVFGQAVNGIPQYVPRLRRCESRIFTVDSAGIPRRAELSILLGYKNSKAPAIWDGTGTRYRVHGGWELLRDRIGVRLTSTDPNAWDVGEYTQIPGMFGGLWNTVENLTGTQLFSLLLTVVFSADIRPKQVAKRQISSPISYTIERLLDQQDRYKLQYIHSSSPYYSGSSLPTDPNLKNVVVARDDRPKSLAEASASRSRTQNVAFAGPIVIPRLDTSYAVGDRIKSIDGRGLSLGISAAPTTGQLTRYPRVVGVSITAQSGFSTILQLSDDIGSAPGNHHRESI